MSEPPLLRRLPDNDDPDAILEGFFDYLESSGI